MDLRVRRTRKALWEALLGLLDGKPFDEITVDEVCARAMVNRTTFYKHYRDKRELAVDGAEGLLQALTDRLTGTPVDTVRQAARGLPPEHLSVLFKHIAAEPVFFRLAFSPDVTLPFRSVLETMIGERTLARLAQLDRPAGHPVADEMIAAFSAGALLSVLAWWVRDGLRVPPDEVTERVTYLMTHGLQVAAGARPERTRTTADAGG